MILLRASLTSVALLGILMCPSFASLNYEYAGYVTLKPTGSSDLVSEIDAECEGAFGKEARWATFDEFLRAPVESRLVSEAAHGVLLSGSSEISADQASFSNGATRYTATASFGCSVPE